MELKINKFKIASLFIGMIIPIIICVVLSRSLVIGFFIATVIDVTLLVQYGFKSKSLIDMMWASIVECKNIYMLILLIGATVSIWLASGVVPALIYYGSYLLKDSNFILMAFLIVMVCSAFIGSAIATISTIGIAIIGIGVSFNIPANLLLGVVVSGAYVADKISPLSGLFNLTIESANTKFKETIKNMMRTFIPTIIIVSIIYYLIGMKYMGGNDILEVLKLQDMIKESFNISPLLLIIPIIVVLLSMKGFGALKSISMGCFVGTIATYFYQNVDVIQIFKWIIFGYKSISQYEYINNLLFSGGIFSMLEVIFIIMGAVSIGGLLEKTGVLRLALNSFINRRLDKNTLIIKTSIISILLTVLTCDQTMGIIIPSKFFKEKFDELALKREVLVRTISDSGTIVAPLMPWNINAIIIASVTGISSGYAVFSILCFIFPLVTIAVSLIENMRRKGDENYVRRSISKI